MWCDVGIGPRPGSNLGGLFFAELKHTVIRFVSTNAKFGICTVVGLNGTLVVEDKMCIHSKVKVNILASTSVPFRPTITVQMPNLALT